MAEPITPFTLDLNDAIKRAIAAVPFNREGQASFGFSTSGLEIAAGWKPSVNFWLGGTVEMLWSGKPRAGIKGQLIW